MLCFCIAFWWSTHTADPGLNTQTEAHHYRSLMRPVNRTTELVLVCTWFQPLLPKVTHTSVLDLGQSRRRKLGAPAERQTRPAGRPAKATRFLSRSPAKCNLIYVYSCDRAISMRRVPENSTVWCSSISCLWRWKLFRSVNKSNRRQIWGLGFWELFFKLWHGYGVGV